MATSALSLSSIPRAEVPFLAPKNVLCKSFETGDLFQLISVSSY